MSTSRRVLLIRSGLCLATAAAPTLVRAAAPLAVIVGTGCKLDSVSKAELKRLFLGETDNISGNVLVPFNMAASLPERSIFLKAVLGMTPDQESKYWIDRRIRGQGGSPKSAPNIDALLKVAAKFPKAITYVPATLTKPDVKVLRVEGKLPTDAGYSLVG
ncbi:MAG: hypothetical protein SF187_21480 [Deltaproteobacteria bacterium]|nr:hypothetical protein [Deltaproteobacteria bacterium]